MVNFNEVDPDDPDSIIAIIRSCSLEQREEKLVMQALGFVHELKNQVAAAREIAEAHNEGGWPATRAVLIKIARSEAAENESLNRKALMGRQLIRATTRQQQVARNKQQIGPGR